MATITQDMHYRLSLIKYAVKYGVTKAVIRYTVHLSLETALQQLH